MISAVVVRAAQSIKEAKQAAELIVQVFGAESAQARSQHRQRLALDPCADLRDLIVGVHGEEVVAVTRIISRRLSWNGTWIPTSGLTHIAVRSDYRGRGLSRPLMEAALNRAGERQDVLAVLFARRAVGNFYAQFGFVGLGCHPELRAGSDVAHGLVSAGVRLTEGLHANEWAVYRTLYEASYGEVPLSLMREASWWEAGAERLALALGPDWSQQTYRILQDETVIGYAISRQGRIIEVGAEPDAQQACALGLGLLARQWKQDLLVSMPPHHGVLRALQQHNHHLTIRYVWDGGHMARLLNPHHALEAAPWLALLKAPARLLATHDPLPELPAWSVLDEF